MGKVVTLHQPNFLMNSKFEQILLSLQNSLWYKHFTYSACCKISIKNFIKKMQSQDFFLHQMLLQKQHCKMLSQNKVVTKIPFVNFTNILRKTFIPIIFFKRRTLYRSTKEKLWMKWNQIIRAIFLPHDILLQKWPFSRLTRVWT